MTSFQGSGVKGCGISEFTSYLLNPHLSSKHNLNGWAFWYPKTEFVWDDFLEEEKIQCWLETLTSEESTKFLHCPEYMVQFWGMKEGCLTTVDQPFTVVGPLYKGYSWYRKLCEDLQYSSKEEVGPVGRVYLSGKPESTPDLSLYSATEFPLRNDAARCGLRSYVALPIFDLLSQKCYGVLEFVSLEIGATFRFLLLNEGIKNTGLRSTCIDFTPKVDLRRPPPSHQLESEIAKMMKSAVELVPQLHLVQIWSPCNNTSCMHAVAFFEAKGTGKMRSYLDACTIHHLKAGTWMGKPLISVDRSKSYFCQNICDFNILENPLAHYAQRERFSFCFVVLLQNMHNNNHHYLVEFFFQSNSREDTSFLHLLLKIMEMELKSFKFEKSVVELRKTSELTTYEHVELKHQHLDLEEINTKGHTEIYSLSDFKNYLQMPHLSCLQDKKKQQRQGGWLFEIQEISDNGENITTTLLNNFVQEKIKNLMTKIATKGVGGLYFLVQFWAVGMIEDRPCLESSKQPFILSSLYKGLASFRKQCMESHYFLDEQFGPLERVFRSGHPESSPDIGLYSTTDFPLRDHALHCHLTTYHAFPIFGPHKNCFGILECIGTDDSEVRNIYTILKKLKVASPCLTRDIKIQSTFRHVFDLGPSETEILTFLKLLGSFPYLFRTEAWVTYNGCDGINTNVHCFEEIDAFSYILLPRNFWQAQTGKGFIGMLLASENKLCFCQNLCDFSIADEPRAHYTQRGRLDVCFAICLQSSHKGNLLYILQFFLYQGPAKLEYLSSFLHILFPILKQELTSFKVASGKQLGDDLVVDVIQFPQGNQLTCELDESFSSPFKFKTVLYGLKEPQHELHHSVPQVKGSVPSIQPSNAATSISREKELTEVKIRGKRKGSLNIGLEDLEPHFGKTLKQVAEAFGVGKSTVKRACRDLGIDRWSKSEKYMKNLFEAIPASQDFQHSSSSTLPSLDMPLPNNLPPTNVKTTLQQQHVTDLQPQTKMMVKAKCEDMILKFKLCLSSTMNNLLQQVARRLDLEIGSFRLGYLDEDNDNILLACDDDLQLYLTSLKATDKTIMQLLIHLITSKKSPGASISCGPSLLEAQQLGIGRHVVNEEILCRNTQSSALEMFISLMPVEFQTYIIDCKNVEGDGHCGFRVVAALMGFGEDSWSRVRQDLMTELVHHTNLYKGAFKEEDRVQEIFKSLNCFANIAPFKNWFMLPYMGYLVASIYNVAFISLSTQISLTFLPLRSAVPQCPRSISMGMVNHNHFVQVLLSDGRPMPPIANSWFDSHLKIADGWEEAYKTSHIS